MSDNRLYEVLTLLLGSNCVGKLVASEEPHSNVHLLGLKERVKVVVVLPRSVGDEHINKVEEFHSRLRQVNLLHVAQLLHSDAEIVGVVPWVPARFIVYTVAQIVGLGPGSELKALVSAVVEPVETEQ